MATTYQFPGFQGQVLRWRDRKRAWWALSVLVAADLGQ